MNLNIVDDNVVLTEFQEKMITSMLSCLSLGTYEVFFSKENINDYQALQTNLGDFIFTFHPDEFQLSYKEIITIHGDMSKNGELLVSWCFERIDKEFMSKEKYYHLFKMFKNITGVDYKKKFMLPYKTIKKEYEE